MENMNQAVLPVGSALSIRTPQPGIHGTRACTLMAAAARASRSPDGQPPGCWGSAWARLGGSAPCGRGRCRQAQGANPEPRKTLPASGPAHETSSRAVTRRRAQALSVSLGHSQSTRPVPEASLCPRPQGPKAARARAVTPMQAPNPGFCLPSGRPAGDEPEAGSQNRLFRYTERNGLEWVGEEAETTAGQIFVWSGRQCRGVRGAVRGAVRCVASGEG